MGQYCFARWRLSSSSVIACNTGSLPAGERTAAARRSAGRHSTATAGQSCYVSLGRHIILFVFVLCTVCTILQTITCVVLTMAALYAWYSRAIMCGGCWDDPLPQSFSCRRRANYYASLNESPVIVQPRALLYRLSAVSLFCMAKCISVGKTMKTEIKIVSYVVVCTSLCLAVEVAASGNN